MAGELSDSVAKVWGSEVKHCCRASVACSSANVSGGSDSLTKGSASSGDDSVADSRRSVNGDKGLGAVTEVCGTGLFDDDRGSRVSSEACGRSSALGGRGSEACGRDPEFGGGPDSEACGRDPEFGGG